MIDTSGMMSRRLAAAGLRHLHIGFVARETRFSRRGARRAPASAQEGARRAPLPIRGMDQMNRLSDVDRARAHHGCVDARVVAVQTDGRFHDADPAVSCVGGGRASASRERARARARARNGAGCAEAMEKPGTGAGSFTRQTLPKYSAPEESVRFVAREFLR